MKWKDKMLKKKNEKKMEILGDEREDRLMDFMNHSYRKDLEMMLPVLPFRTNFFICSTSFPHTGKNPITLELYNESRNSDIYSISYIGERGNMFDGRLFIVTLEMAKDNLGEETEIAERDLMINMGLDPQNVYARHAVYASFIKMSRTIIEIEYEDTIGTTLLLDRASRYKLSNKKNKAVYKCAIPESFGFLLDKHYSKINIKHIKDTTNSPVESRLTFYIHSNDKELLGENPYLNNEQIVSMIDPQSKDPSKLMRNLKYRTFPSLVEKGIIKDWGYRRRDRNVIEFKI